MPDFLVNVDAAKGRWRDIGTKTPGFAPQNFWSGHGRDAIEVAYAIALHKPTITDVRDLWRHRHGRSAAPLLLVVSYPTHPGARAMVCGPTGEAPVVVDLDLDQADRLARAALSEPNRHQATSMLVAALEHANDAVPGLHNRGLLATHELVNGVPTRTDWAAALAHGQALLDRRSHDLMRGLGYRLEQVGQHHLLRSQEGNARAIAVFLQDEEQPDAPSFRYELQTPASYALAQADRENLPWVITVRSSSIRLYSTSTSGAAGQRGRTETFVELDLALLPSNRAGYLHLLFASAALARDGVLGEIQLASRDFTSGLSERLRERVYGQAVPRLGLAIARQVGGTAQEDLERHYRTTLTILFRLLFIAYAEDSKLLPLHVNGDYTDHSLKRLAHRLAEAINEGRDLGFDDPLTGRLTDHADHEHDDLWQTCVELFGAVDKGHTRWGVPAYNGGLFSAEASVNPVGGIIDSLRLTNAELGPALASLIIDRSPDGLVGPIDFRSLSVREFGTIYEGLLESELSVADQELKIGKDGAYLPAGAGDIVEVHSGDVYLHNRSGQRKSTGSYFTKPFAVDHLLDRAVIPTLEAHLQRVQHLLEAGQEADAADALFDFRVADIAMGSGHFLTAVVDRVEAHVSRFLGEHPLAPVLAELDLLRRHAMDALGDHAPAVEIETASLLRRLIARRCVYGVDLNPVSVELARVSMWIHTFVPGLPLSFLNHNLIVGDSLTGIGTVDEALAVLEQGQGPKTSFQAGIFDDPLRDGLEQAKAPLKRLARLVDATPQNIEAARRTDAEIRAAIEPVTAFFDLTVAVRLGHAKVELIDSPDKIAGLVDRTDDRKHAQEMRAVHFPIAFPEVFLRERPGFDVIVGNPPWEKPHVEEHEFWGRHFPGLRGQNREEREARIAEYTKSRSDLVQQLSRERQAMHNLSEILGSGPYGLGRGHRDLAKAFAWRFWHLLRDGGRFGVVVPRQAILAAPGMKAWRELILEEGAFDDVTLLENKANWVFDGMEPRYTIGLLAVGKDSTAGGFIRLNGPHRNLEEFRAAKGVDHEAITSAEFRTWGESLVFPTLSAPSDIAVYRTLHRHPKLGDDRADFHFRPLQGDINANTDRSLYVAQALASKTVLLPVYSGASFNLWQPDTGAVYAWVQEDEIEGFLLDKRTRQARHRMSAYFGLGSKTLHDKATLDFRRPRVAFRDIARATDSRTLITVLIPPNSVVQHTAPFLVCRCATEADEAFLVGILASRILDWLARRTVEAHVTFTVFNGLPVPEAARDHPGRQRIIQLAGRLAAVDERYADWAAAVGVEYGPVHPHASEEMQIELDACVARLYGLDERQIRDLFATFHPTWDHEPWTERVLEYYRAITWEPAEVPA